MTAQQLGFALDCARESPGFVVPGAEEEIEAAVIQLKAATMRPMWMDAQDAVAYEEALIKACEDYPIDVVQEACANWRKVPDHGKWWPTEQDLRAQCEKVFAPRRSLFNKARVLLQDLRAKEDEAQRANDRSAFAGDRQRQFREEMRKRMNNPNRFEAYFGSSQIQYEGEREILVRSPIAESVLQREGADLIARLGLSVRCVPVAFAGIKAPQWEDDSPEDRALVKEKFKALKERFGGLA